MEFKEVKNIKECERLWNIFSPHRTIYQEWDFRYTHYKYFNYPIKFIVGMDANQPIGILPLQYEPEEEFWEFFGGQEMEDNGIWVKSGYENRLEDFLKAVSEDVWLDYLAGDSEFIQSLSADDISYELDLIKFTGAADFVENHLSGHLRKHVRSAYKAVSGLGPEIIRGDWSDLEKMFDLSADVFGEESGFNDPYSREIYRDLLKLPYDWRIFSVRFGGVIRAVSLAVFYKDIYYFYTVGYDRGTVKDLNAFLNLQNIDEAKKLGAKKINFGYHDCGWKERWGLSRIVYHEYWHGLTPED